MKVSLSVEAGPHEGRTFEFEEHATFLVGRGPTAHLRLADDRHFSRNHFLLELNPPRCYLRDLSSTNGTIVNRQRVREAYLQDGDIIEGGTTRIRFRMESPSSSPSESAASEAVGTAALSPSELATTSETPPALSESETGNPHGRPGEVPPQVPDYDVVRKLGKGGMGVVYLSRQKATGRKFALKLIVPESAASEKAMARFLREVSVLSQLRHPHIVAFHGMGLVQGRFYFVMEYVEVIDYLAILTARPDHQRIRAACRLMCQVLSGLGEAHGSGFVHRDIKPSNLLVGREGSRYTAKLADFGLAKNFENAGFSGMTRSGETLGTLAYMAPEQVINARRATPSVDIYSVGATLYRLLGGRPPYGSLESNDLILAILERDAEALERVNPAVPAVLARVIDRAMARDLNERYPSASELREALLPFAKV